jgi:hypothetical protein
MLAAGACSSEGDAEPADATPPDRDSPEVGVVVAVGDLVAALQDERRSTQASLQGRFDEPGIVRYDVALDAARDAGSDLALAIDELDVGESLEVEAEVSEITTDLVLLRNEVVRVWPIGGGSYDDGGALAGRFGPIITRLLDIQRRYAETRDDPVVDVYIRTSRIVEDLLEVARIAESGDPTWPDTVASNFDAVVDAHDRLLAVADTSLELTDATAALQQALADAGFGTAPPADPATFVTTLSLGAWRAYQDIARQYLANP